MKLLPSLTLVLLSSVSCLSLASVKISNMALQDNLVTFTTTPAKPDTALACVDSGSKDTWAAAIDTYSGRALYTMLVTAVGENLSLEIESAGDCNAAGNIERPAMVRIAAQSEANIDIAQKLEELMPFGMHYNRLWIGDEKITSSSSSHQLEKAYTSDKFPSYIKDGGSSFKIGSSAKVNLVNLTNHKGFFAGFVIPYINQNGSCVVDVALDGITKRYEYAPTINGMLFAAGASRSSDNVEGRVMLSAGGAASSGKAIPFNQSLKVDVQCSGDFGAGRYAATAYQITQTL